MSKVVHLVALTLASVASAGLIQPGNATPPVALPEAKSAETTPSHLIVPEAMQFVRFGEKAPKPRADGSVRVMNWNVENLFDDKDDPALSGRYEDLASAKPKEHLDAVAAIIRAVDPDIIALQEIESKAALTWFVEGWLKDAGYTHIASIDAGDERGIEQAVISRFPITSEKNWPKGELGAVAPAGKPGAGQPLTMHRSPLLVTVQVPAEKTAGGQPADLTLMVVHQKSGRDWSWFREIESAKFAEIIRGVLADPKQSNFIFAGDFNALPKDASFRTYLSTGLVDLFDARAAAGSGENNPEFVTHASGRIIDHILVSPSVADMVVAETKFILGTPILPEGVDYRQAPSPPGYSSDHFPLVVDLRVK